MLNIEKNSQSKVVKTGMIQRNANFELLRILAICAIIFHHFVYHYLYRIIDILKTGSVFAIQPGSDFITTIHSHTVGVVTSNIVNSGGKIGVCIFFLISGYFGIKGNFTTKKMFNLWKILLFYTIFSFVIQFIIDPVTRDSLLNHPGHGIGVNIISKIFTLLFPVIHYNSLFWFIPAYLAVLAMSHFINEYLRKISKRRFLFLLLSWSVLFYTINTCLRFGSFPPRTDSSLGILNQISLSLPLGILFYITGAYFSLHPTKHPRTLVLTFLGIGCILEIPFLWWLYSGAMPIAMEVLSRGDDSVTVFLFSLSIFLVFSLITIKEKPSKVINSLSKNVVEVYLFHYSVFEIFLFIIQHFITKIPWFDTEYWFTFGKLEVFGCIITPLIFLFCIGFAEIRIRASHAIFNLKPVRIVKCKISQYLE